MLKDRDYRILASVRAELRNFAHFTEARTKGVGLTPQQHQILLALRAAEAQELTVGEVAKTMLLKQHSISGMADRLAALALAEQVQATRDRRRVHLRLTARAEAVLASLGQVHKAELRRIRHLLTTLLSELD